MEDKTYLFLIVIEFGIKFLIIIADGAYINI